jgi:hypothetical protein
MGAGGGASILSALIGGFWLMGDSWAASEVATKNRANVTFWIRHLEMSSILTDYTPHLWTSGSDRRAKCP